MSPMLPKSPRVSYRTRDVEVVVDNSLKTSFTCFQNSEIIPISAELAQKMRETYKEVCKVWEDGGKPSRYVLCHAMQVLEKLVHNSKQL